MPRTPQNHDGVEIGPVGRALEKAIMLKKTARCPECGEPVSALTNGSYACEGGPAYADAPHIYHSRFKIDGDIRWWHGRLPNTLGVVALAIYILFRVIYHKASEHNFTSTEVEQR